MDWDDTKYFLAVAREGQMLGAARRLRVSQAMISRRLQSLEESVGVRLFDRSTRGCELTDDGRAFLENAERIEAEVLTALSRLDSGGGALTGTVRIGAPDGLGSAFLASRLGEIAATFPDLRIQLVPLPRNFSLSEREADIAIMIGRPVKGRLRTKWLTDYTLGLYASRDYFARAGRPASIDELDRHRLVGYVEDLIYTPELNYAEEFRREWRSAIEVSTAIGQLAAVRSGAGIGILHDFMAADDPSLEPLFPEIVVTRSYWAAWHEDLRASRRVNAVVAALERIVRGERALFRRSRTA